MPRRCSQAVKDNAVFSSRWEVEDTVLPVFEAATNHRLVINWSPPQERGNVSWLRKLSGCVQLRINVYPPSQSRMPNDGRMRLKASLIKALSSNVIVALTAPRNVQLRREEA